MYIDLKQNIIFYYNTLEFKEKIKNTIIKNMSDYIFIKNMSDYIFDMESRNEKTTIVLLDGSIISICSIKQALTDQERGQRYTLTFIEKNKLLLNKEDIDYFYKNCINGFVYVVDDNESIDMQTFTSLMTLQEFIQN